MSRIKWLEEAREELCGQLARENPAAKVLYTRTVHTKTSAPRVEVRHREQPASKLSSVLRVCRNIATSPLLIADLSAWIEAVEFAERVHEQKPR